MKLIRPVSYVPYGPVGHPKAQLFLQFEGTDRATVSARFKQHMANEAMFAQVPFGFINPQFSLIANGYHILEVVDSEIADAAISSLPVSDFYRKRELSRNIADYLDSMPRRLKHSAIEVWEAGDTACEHDFGLESAEALFKEEVSQKVIPLSKAMSLSYTTQGLSYLRYTCTKCMAQHAVAEVLF